MNSTDHGIFWIGFAAGGIFASTFVLVLLTLA